MPLFKKRKAAVEMMLLLFLASVSLTTSAESFEITKFDVLTIQENKNNTVWILNYTGFTGNVNYTLKQYKIDNTWKKFSIVGAELRQNSAFDFENGANDGRFDILVAKNGQIDVIVNIQITITDANDHTPVITNLPSTVTVSEAIGVNATIFTITGKDDDGTNQFNLITFYIIDGNSDDKFYLSYVDQKSSSVKLRSRLDYDTGPVVYNLTINATDAHSGNNPIGLWSLSYLVIKITDVDDLPASFTKEVYGPINIAENLATGSFVTQVTAVDKDKTVKDEVFYSLVQATNPGGVFMISETTGNITLYGSLDRNTQSFYALLVKANSTYHDPVHALVLISLDDANVHKPNFTSDTYVGQVAENAVSGTLVLVVQATDLDQGNNAEVSYSLAGEHDDKFIITTVNSLGYIYVNSSLDYDVKNYYNFLVVATEILTSEKYNDTATVVMNVTEILSNENNPNFSQASYEANFTEGMPPGRVLQVNAVDLDQEHYGRVTYSIVHDAYGLFTIDSKAGWINTSSLLDREVRDSYTLVVRASDGDTTARHTDVLVVVTVLDINDNSPTFSANSYSGTVVENSNVGNTILAVEAKDLDVGANAAFNFSVFGGDENFSIISDGNRGYVIVNGSLDYEVQKEYTFVVIAKETATSEKNHANVTVTVSLIDVNDNSPVFSSVSGYSVSVAEDSRNGTSMFNVSATDQDSGTFGEIVYTLYTLSVPFTINPTTGEITTAGNLDRETKNGYSLTIKAQDGGQPSLFSYAQVIINITDTNDNPPIFSPSAYAAEIEENMKIGSSILTVTATDADEGTNSYLRYYIQDSNGLFDVGSDGVVVVNGSLDYESNVAFTIVVFAEERSTTEKWKANCTVTIRLKDMNEFDPEFTLSSYYGYVKENSASGSLVVTVQASDQDGVLNVITYEIVSGNEEGNFSIDQTSGAIKTTRPIDRETTEQYILKIRASDNGTPNRTTETFVVIEIFDANDHSPVFTQSFYNTSVPESLPVGTTILTVKAIDLDVNSTNSDIRYFISGSDSKFDVTTSGHVFVNGTLNFENKSTYSFMIFAEETGTVAKQQHNASIVITVMDVNEYDPVFTQSGFYGNVSENAANGTAVVKISALDQDGYYNVIKYSINHGNYDYKFFINGSSGVVFTAGSLDRETKSEYILTVKAEDNGDPARTSEVTVVINILDVSDNGPMFNQPTYNATIFENIEPGTTVLTVQAQDQDEGENAQFDFHIVGGGGYFEVSSGGVIVTKATLDYETSTSHTFLVIANETNSSGSKKANATVTIFVRDVNEFNPVFTQLRYTVNVSENNAVGTPLVQVNASDKDGFYNKLTYSIVSGNDDSKFTINASTGLIRTNATLDRETLAQFILSVRSDDNGISPRTAEAVVIVNVVDLSDHSPAFHQANYNASVFENVAVGTAILTVEATDNDKGENALIHYSIVGGDGAFRVTKNGDIIVNASLDYEDETKYDFQVIAKESQAASSLNDSTNVTIFVQDVNEYNPVFNQLSYSATVNDTLQQGTPVIQVTATDGDGLYKMITYSIVYGNDAGVFEINSTTGWISTKTALDSATRNQYIFTVKAEDNGVFPRTAEVLVVININETNKNATFLVQDIYNVTVLENALVDSTVVKLDIRDNSKDETSVFSFNIVGGNGDFNVSSLGEVQVERSLDYETKSLYSFKITVTEIQPASGLAANATVNINVLDVNEFNPKFSQDHYVGNVSEGAAVGTFIVQVSASDSDGFYNISTYTIIYGNEQNNFTINATTGEIKTATPLDREVKDQYILTVRAQDNGPSGRTAEVVVIVDIVDISDHPPLFLMSNYSGVIFENAPVGSTVLTVKTSDLDMDTKSSLIYTVVGGDGKFGVTSDGVIYVNGSLDYETKTVHTFFVTAEEPSPFSHHKDNVSVSVKLMDINEFNPEFNQSVYSASVNEKDVIGTSVVTVFASDKDGYFNLVTYSIVFGNSHGNVSINNNTGTITTAKPLDRESHHQVILTVRGEDNGIPPRTSEVTVIIGITDSNDNGPVFQMSYYNGSISEEASTDTIVLAVLALDQDSTPNSLIYHIDSENTFKMETRYGIGFVVVNKEMDYEMKKSYSFMVYAIEETAEKRNTSVQVNITVLDANDNRPVFENSSYTGTVIEGMVIATPILTVSASDADSEAFRPVYFEIVEGDPLGNFTINNMTGLLETATVLDREIQQIFSLIIEARDSGSPALTETVAVTISVVDRNDASPRFIGLPYTADVQENSPVDTNVLTIQALDMDKSENGEFMFSLVGDDGLFSITQDGNIGHIKVDGLLDYEKNKTFKFYVVAKETKSSEKRESNASVVVTLIDVNDNSPVFQKPPYEENVGESSSFPSSVGTVSAVDKDSGTFGNIMFFIIHGNENGNFTINNKSGLVETATILDRESQDRYVLTIEARDGGSPPRTAVTIMVIKVTDENEQPPIFHDTPYEATVVENRNYIDSVILKVSASDPDKMEITFTLQPSSPFTIDQMTGLIKVTENFDRENKSVYNLTVTAIDKGGFNVSEQVLIRVIDTNDNFPQFLNTPYETSIPDNTTIGTSIMTVTVTDADEAHNAEIIFSLLGAGGRFAINQTTGEITVVEKLDRQNEAMYELQVIATDRGIPEPRVNSTTVVVNLTDYSNSAPKFERVAYVGEINETLMNKIFVLNVKANDLDAGILGEITYSITGGNTYNAFEINSTGAILSTIALDYENDTQKTFDLTVTAADRDGLKDTTQVRVTVLDVNDNAPTIVNIPSPAEFNISDQVPADTLLYVLQAQDFDSGENGEFEFSSTAVPDNLTVHQTRGVIKAKTVLQNALSVSLTVSVSDKGSPSKRSPNYTILFTIATNPISPPFLLPSLTEVTVYEDASIGDVISKINSSLSADNFSIIFQLPNGGHFKIDNQGSLSLAQQLDWETVDGYSILVKAVKGGNQALGYVSVTVGDVNDEDPEFLFEIYKGQIKENAAVGSTILAVKAVDKDQGNTVSYSITSGNSEGVFNISADGEITIANPLDYEKENFFNLTVVASDGVNDGTALVEITIVNVNDNAPTFLNSSYSSTIPEDTPGGTSVLKVSSVDNDGDIIIYSISGTDGKFTIDSISGVITTTAKRLDYETKAKYFLNVTADDTKGLQTSVMVIVNITDTNEDGPIFEKVSYNVTITEGYLGILPVSVNATDNDSGQNGNVTYSFKRPSSLFSINPLTGTINSTVAIDRDGVGVSTDASCHGVFVLFVQAKDGASVPLTDSTTVTVYVTDANDNKPMFSKIFYEVPISVADTGEVVLVKASDSDCGVNAAIRYSYTSDNGTSLFQINPTIGNVTTKKALNGSQGVYFLNVSATNEQGSPKLQSSVMVKITVIENKNYAPVFVKSEYSFSVSEGAEIGFTLGSVTAKDINQGKNGVFIYSIQNPGYAIPFGIDPVKGSIILVRELNREERINYTLLVVAKDFGEPSLNQTTTVVITVDDVNDEVPKFAKNVLSFETPENLTLGSYVAFVNAIDGDHGEHGKPIYVIYSGNEEGYFRIDNSTGFIYLMKELDRELINVFELIVRAYNYGSNVSRRKRDAEPTFSQVKVIINITDINDNYPEFVQTDYVAGFKDSSQPGTKVATVLAVDKDEGLNGQIVYKIASGNEAGAFEIDPKTGLITTTAAVSQLSEPFISLTVAAQDSSGQPNTAQKSASVKIYKLDSNPLFVNISSSTDRETIINLLKNITGPNSDIIIESITLNGLLSNVKYYVVKNGDFITQFDMANYIIQFCEENEDVCKEFGINLAEQNSGQTSAFLGEDDISILEAVLLLLGVIVGIGGLLGILLLCCLRRRKRYMPVYEPNAFILPSKAVSFDEKPRYFRPDPQSQESQEVEIHIDEEVASVDSADEVHGSTASNDSAEIDKTEAIAKVNAYMNQALMNDDDDSDSDSSEDTEPGTHLQSKIDGDSLRGSTEPLVGAYNITDI